MLVGPGRFVAISDRVLRTRLENANDRLCNELTEILRVLSPSSKFSPLSKNQVRFRTPLGVLNLTVLLF